MTRTGGTFSIQFSAETAKTEAELTGTVRLPAARDIHSSLFFRIRDSLPKLFLR